ncbi:putative leucine-rich repeat domain superfamily [Helianthus annuus]|uniref:late blight resistance protein R1-A-like n=1 Tax=Helianthus annuus TaxID=4232 RepID=UPI000B8FC4E3|nr:late blight resistance protein R1-A-like [Helianthus annuus]KAJ0877852.1 putative leucine-rich repeat domain superfamily [Helianthus annuus]
MSGVWMYSAGGAIGGELARVAPPTPSGLSFAMLTHLEALNIYKYKYEREPLTLSNPIRFPETLKKPTLKGLCLPWNYMSTIQRLPKLEVLKLLDSSFTGHLWETGDEQFHQLKYLKLTRLNIRVWEASSINFPSLRKLAVRSCKDLREIPLVLGNISTLEYINIDYSNSRVLESVNRIQNAQHDIGNYDIHVSITHMDQSEVFFQGGPLHLHGGGIFFRVFRNVVLLATFRSISGDKSCRYCANSLW